MLEGRHIDYRSSMVDTSITDLRRSAHRSSVFEGQHIHLRRSTHRSSKVDTSISEGRHIVTSIFEGRHIDLRRATHRSSKGNTSIFEGQHIDIRKLTHRSSKVTASIFEDRRRKHHTYNSSSNIAHNCAPKSLEWTKLHTLIRTCIKINIFNIRQQQHTRDPTRALVMY